MCDIGEADSSATFDIYLPLSISKSGMAYFVLGG